MPLKNVLQENNTDSTTVKPVCGSCYGAEDSLLNITYCLFST